MISQSQTHFVQQCCQFLCNWVQQIKSKTSRCKLKVHGAAGVPRKGRSVPSSLPLRDYANEPKAGKEVERTMKGWGQLRKRIRKMLATSHPGGCCGSDGEDEDKDEAVADGAPLIPTGHFSRMVRMVKSSTKILVKGKQFVKDNDPAMPLAKLKHTHPCFAAVRAEMMANLFKPANGGSSVLDLLLVEDSQSFETVECLHF